jgi:hypothetical protein
MPTTNSRRQKHTLEVPGAVLHYDVRAHDSSTEPVLLLIGFAHGRERIRQPG